MKIQTQPDVPCPRGCGPMTGKGECGNNDLYHCETCGKMEWKRYQERRGSARKKATDDPILVTACSGIIIDSKEALDELTRQTQEDGFDYVGNEDKYE